MTNRIYAPVWIPVRVKAIGLVPFHPVLPIMAEDADARVKTATGPRAVVAIWQES